MDSEDAALAGAAVQAEMVRAGEVSSRELVEMTLDRVTRLDTRLRACTLVLDDAISAADAADRRRGAGESGPLLGVPIVVKDSLDVAGRVTSHGTSAVTQAARADCEAVGRLRTAGAVLIAKTTMPELAAFTHFTSSQTFGTTRNPWDPERSPGGSSGGSAVAVAAGYVGAALATDGGGSIRVPAACCGVVGLKPTRGRVPWLPHGEHWNGMSVIGPIGRQVVDVALMMDVLTSADPSNASTVHRDALRPDPLHLNVALSLRPALPTKVDDEVTGAVRAVAGLLERLGHHVEPADPEYGNVRALTVPRYLNGIATDARLLDDPARLERRTRSLVRLGRLITRRRLAGALARERDSTTKINELFNRYDVLLTPVVARAAPPSARFVRRGAIANLVGGVPWIAFTQVWNVTGQPALSIPAGFDHDGMPLAVQLVGRANDEPLLLGLANQLESAMPRESRQPDLT